jgi:hypothetical protein
MVYIYHSTSLENLIDILKSNIIYANKYLPESKRILSGDSESIYIYTKLHLPKSKTDIFGFTLILNPTILCKESYVYNNGWFFDPNEESIFVYSDDNKKLKFSKLKKIKTLIKQKNNRYKKEKYNVNKLMGHEVLFIERINLKDYLIGIAYHRCNTSKIKKIKSILKSNKMSHVKFYKTPKLLPDLNLKLKC